MYRWTIPTSEGGISISASGGPEREGRFSGSGSNRSLIPSGTNPPDRSVRPSTLAFNMICEDGAEDDAPADPSPLPSGVVRLQGGGNSALAVAAGAATGAVLFVSALRVAVFAWRSFVKCAPPVRTFVDKLHIEVRRSRGCGLGLFARCDMDEGTAIVSMDRPVRTIYNSAAARAETLELPSDSFMFVAE